VLRTAALRDGPGMEFWEAQDALVLDAETSPEVTTILDGLHADVVIVRPDRSVLFRGEELSAPSASVAALLHHP